MQLIKKRRVHRLVVVEGEVTHHKIMTTQSLSHFFRTTNGREARKVGCWVSSPSATFFVTSSVKQPSANLQSRQNVSQQLLPSPKGPASLSTNQYINFPWVCPIIIALLKHCNRVLWIPHVVLLMAFLCCVVYCHAVLDLTSHLYLLSAFCNSILHAHNQGAIIQREDRNSFNDTLQANDTRNFWLSNVHTSPMPSVWYTLRVV